MKYILVLISMLCGASYFIKISKKSSRIVKLIYFVIMYNLMIKFLIGNLGLPSSLNYLSDFVIVWIVLEIFAKRKRAFVPTSMKWCFGALIGITVISFMLNMYSPLLYIWGFRNVFRFLIFAMICAAYLEKRDISTIMNILIFFFFLNVIVVTYQRFFVVFGAHSDGDFISGLFSNGMERGGNASLNWLMCIVCTYIIVRYIYKKESFAMLTAVLASAIYMAALAEIKLFFLQLVLISLIALLLCKKSLKVFGFAVVGVAALVFGVRMLAYFYPGFADFFTIESIMGYATKERGYSGGGLDRLTVIPYVLQHYLRTPLSVVFGIGLGNADYSSNFTFLISDFYRQNSLSNYTFFMSAFLMIELGFSGLIMYVIMLLNYARAAFQNNAKTAEESAVNISTIILVIVAITMLFSNQTLRIEASAYMLYGILTFPFILRKDFLDDDLDRPKVYRSPVRFTIGRSQKYRS